LQNNPEYHILIKTQLTGRIELKANFRETDKSRKKSASKNMILWMLNFGGNLGFPPMSFNATPHHNINQHLYLNPSSRVYFVHQLSPFRTFFQNK